MTHVRGLYVPLCGAEMGQRRESRGAGPARGADRFHVVARGRGLLFTSWEEGRALFRRLAGVPGVAATCVMPDHVPLVLAPDDAGGRVTVAMGASARWRNHRRGDDGPVWAERPAPERLAELAGCDRTTAWRRTRGVQPRGGHHRDPALAARVRVVEDPRFVALGPVDLRHLPGWGRYARRG